MLAAAAFWYFLAPAPDGQMIVVAVVTAMAIEMAMGFASVTAIYRAKRIDMTDAATELEG